MKRILKIYVIILIVLTGYGYVYGSNTILYNFSTGLQGWSVVNSYNVLRPNLLPPSLHICTIGYNDNSSLSIFDLAIGSRGYMDIEVALSKDLTGIPELFGYFNLRSIAKGEDLLVNLYLKTGQSYTRYFGETLLYGVGQELVRINSDPLSEPWRRMSLSTGGVTNLDDVRAFGFRIFTNTGYGLIPSFYDDGHENNGTTWRKFHFDQVGHHLPEPSTFVLISAGFLCFWGFKRMKRS